MATENDLGSRIAVSSSEAVLESLKKLQLDRKFTDCTIMAPTSLSEDESNLAPIKEMRIDCHRAVLASASVYFADSLKAVGTILHIRDFPAIVVEAIIDFVYTGSAEVPEQNLFTLYEAANRFGIGSLSDCCAQYLLDQAEQGEMTLFQRLDIGLRIGEPRLVQPCMEELLASESTQLAGDDVLALSEKSLRVLLLSEDLQVEESQLFKVVLRWAKARCPESVPLETFIEPYIPLVRYPLMTAIELEEDVVPYKFVPRELLLEAALALCKNPSDWDISKMQFRQRNAVFVHRWKIDWKSVRDEEEVWSDSFSFFFSGVEHRWKLLMYPNGKSAPKYLSFFLYVDPVDASPTSRFVKVIDFDFSLTDFTKRRRPQFFAKEPSTFSPETSSWGFTKFRERKLLEQPSSPFLKDGFMEFELAMKMHSVEAAP
ncbi:hypothetical protein NDN08_007946 [Rhodosorus marinus]|uniref:BTB domain-containing protein n=1 Tax=Rhodosorus marinus TaxID=101924 RepID=A0AAV8V3J5_9RHOD|nr:hypothetical protein NDN08_007946 [Rhodosorus marinus]